MSIVIGLLVSAMSGWILWRLLHPATAVLHGNARKVPKMVRFQPQARTYLTYLMAVVPIYTALLMIGLLTIAGGIMEATRPGFQLPPPRPSVLLAPPIFLIFLTFPMLLVHLCVTLFAQPKFLVARAYRSQAGSIARWRDAKARSARRREQ